jgi:hypothetical protein
MTDDELVEHLVASAPRPNREQVTKLALLLRGCADSTGSAEEGDGCAA